MGRIEIDTSGLRATINQLEEMRRNAQKVIDSTMKDFSKRGPGWVAQEVVKEYNIKKGEVSKSGGAGTVKAEMAGDKAIITYKGRVLTPLHFSLTPKQSKGFRNGKTLVNAEKLNIAGGRTPPAAYARIPRKYKVNVTIKKGSKKQLQGEHDTPVFIGSNGLPFQRTGDGRKIEAIRTLSLPQMVDNETVKENISKAIDEKLGKRFEHYMNRYMSR